jgi:hypothetical protein
MVKIGPYFRRKSRTIYMKGRRWRMTWKRLPTIGHPGGPGGRFLAPPPIFDQRCHHQRKKARAKKSIMKSMSSIVEK